MRWLAQLTTVRASPRVRFAGPSLSRRSAKREGGFGLAGRCRPYKYRHIFAGMETDMIRRLCIPLVLLAVPLTSACIVKETTHRLYLSPRGALTWTVLEQDVRSTESNPANRASEEQAFLDGVASGTHSAFDALARLGPYQSS